MSSSTTPSTRSILVLGAGELGLPILTNLARLAASQPSPVQITALLRPSTISHATGSKAHDVQMLKDLGISLLPCDTNSATHDALTTLFHPFHTVIDCAGMSRPQGGQLHIARAILAAGVRRYIPWQFGVEYDVIGRGSAQGLFDEQLDLRALLRAQHTTSWTIVSTGMFTSFLFEPWFGVVSAEAPSAGPGPGPSITVRALGSWSNAVTTTSPADIGRVTARVAFDDTPTTRNTVAYVAGATITYAQLAAIVENLAAAAGTHREVKREVWTVDDLRAQLEADPGNLMLKYRLVFAAGRGVSWGVEQTVNHRWGMALEDVRAYAERNLDLTEA